MVGEMGQGVRTHTFPMDAVELFRLHIANFGFPAQEGDSDIYAEDVVVMMPYAPEGHTNRIEGPVAVRKFLARIGDFFQDLEMGEPKIQLTEEGLVAEIHGESTSKETGRRYVQDYVMMLRARDGKIAEVKDYYNPMKVLYATGEID